MVVAMAMWSCRCWQELKPRSQLGKLLCCLLTRDRMKRGATASRKSEPPSRGFWTFWPLCITAFLTSQIPSRPFPGRLSIRPFENCFPLYWRRCWRMRPHFGTLSETYKINVFTQRSFMECSAFCTQLRTDSAEGHEVAYFFQLVAGFRCIFAKIELHFNIVCNDEDKFPWIAVWSNSGDFLIHQEEMWKDATEMHMPIIRFTSKDWTHAYWTRLLD